MAADVSTGGPYHTVIWDLEQRRFRGNHKAKICTSEALGQAHSTLQGPTT